MTKYAGKIFEGRWKVIKRERYKTSNSYHFILTNIYNNNIIYISNNSFYKLLNNKTTISKIIKSRLDRAKKGKE